MRYRIAGERGRSDPDGVATPPFLDGTGEVFADFTAEGTGNATDGIKVNTVGNV